MHPHTIIATVLGCGVIAVVAMARPIREELVFGDVPRIPREMAATRKARGEEAAPSSGPRIAHDIARHVGTAAK